MSSQVGISIIICCHNSSQRLPSTLAHLAQQEVHEEIPWEVIIVDNSSTDQTAERARKLWKSYGAESPMKVVKEAKLGLSHARRRGIAAARFEYLVFCDDDNWLAKDYVQTAYDIFENHEEVGIIGGRGEAVCEVSAPNWFEKLEGQYYACGQQYGQSGVISAPTGVVYGAGMCIRKKVFEQLESLGFQFSLTGRKGTATLTAEDIELGLAVRIMGYAIWYDERLRFKHFITSKRLHWPYFVKLRNNYGRAMLNIIPYHHHLLRYPNRLWFYWLWLSKNLVVNLPGHVLRYPFATFKQKQITLHFINTLGVYLKGSAIYLAQRQRIQEFAKIVRGNE